jgi:holo-[acyl-carrier protein] synthase
MIGIDIVKVERIARLIERFGDHALRRFLSENEIREVDNVCSIAGLWAAKEAVGKALGCGICARLGFLDIDIKWDAFGAPKAYLSEKTARFFNTETVEISISHEKEYAIAVAVKTFTATGTNHTPCNPN